MLLTKFLQDKSVWLNLTEQSSHSSNQWLICLFDLFLSPIGSVAVSQLSLSLSLRDGELHQWPFFFRLL